MAAVKKNPAELYAEQVRSGEILVCEYVRLAVERYYADLDRALDMGRYFDKKAAMRAIHFIEKLKHTKGEWAGQRFRLEPWQQFVLWNIFGWKNADGTRRFRYAYIEIARKNGKTALSAGIGLYMLFADGESRPEVYSAATVKDQAKICFSDAVEIVKATDLKNYLTPYRNSIVYELKGGTMKPLSSDYGTHDGLNPSCGIIDEFHAHKDSGMFDVIKSAFGARRQPLMFIITTAGFDKSGVCYAYRENVIKVLRGVNEDDSLFGIIYTLDDKSEWDDPKMWIKANPNLGVSLSADYLADQVKDAKNRPEAVRNVMTKNVDLWVDAERTWILDDVWQKCIGTTDSADLKSCACWGGLDLSNVSDITAYVLLFHENDRFQLLPHFWIPEEKMLEKVRKENINYDKWVAEGYVTVTPGNVIDYDFVKADILRIVADYDLRTSAYDRWNASQTIIDLQNEGMECNPFGQGYGSMSAPTKEFEKLVLTGKIEHFGNPVLRWMLASTLVKTDPAGNIKPDKEKSTQKIDGIVAAIMALGEWMTAQADDESNPYENRGLLTL
ncbi:MULTISPECIES: terminase large subunit [Alistipes]|uniref:terminase large subunit n=1 Tax=Alistipes TaxID=239759 RepID=UPI001B3830F2|nr:MULTISPECIES: terminase TerL endonuclease subunit [Alistipes]MBQ4902236.1 terminase large subunit [Alistipes sp. Marseille-P2263]MCI2257509.1 terminase large subunit [Alistipes dispar]